MTYEARISGYNSSFVQKSDTSFLIFVREKTGNASLDFIFGKFALLS